MVTLTLTDRGIADFNRLRARFADAFNGEEVGIPAMIAVRVQHTRAPGVILTYKHVGNGVLAVHYELENYSVRSDIDLTGTFRAPSGIKPFFDMKAKVTRDIVNSRVNIRIVTPPSDPLYRAWLLDSATADNGTRTTNFEWIMNMHHVATRIMGYIPYAVETKVVSPSRIEATLPANFYDIATQGIEKHMLEKAEKKRFDGWDVVRLSWEQYWKVSKLVEETGKIGSLETLPLARFAVLVQDPGSTEPGIVAKYDTKGSEVSCTLELTNRQENVMYYYDTLSVKNALTGEENLKYSVRDEDSAELSEDNPLLRVCGGTVTTIDVIWNLFINVSSFMLNYRDETMDVEERVCEHQTEGKHSRKHHRSTVRLFKSYTLKKGWKTKANRKKAEIHCLAWGVRGHYRHYKNGKTIFINAYVKGKERDKYAGKDYLLVPEAE